MVQSREIKEDARKLNEREEQRNTRETSNGGMIAQRKMRGRKEKVKRIIQM
jgi:hypothetical protein